MLNIIVCIKQTLDTEEKISVAQGTIQDEGNYIINPYDEYAIEEAIRLKEQLGANVTAITLGPERAESAIRSALALGVDEGIHLVHEAWVLDEYAISKVLAGAIAKRQFDLIFCGNVDVDSGAGQVAIRIAQELNIPHIASVTKFTLESGQVTAERDVEGDMEIIQSALPLLITAQQGLNEPRYPSLPNIMKAKKKPIERAELSVSDMPPAATSRESIFTPEKKKAGRILQGDLQNQVKEMVKVLNEEAKII
jgi:electron transfer flavoprotein beta subunit